MGWLNDKGQQAPRGHLFKNNYDHSISKKRRMWFEVFESKPAMSISNMSVQYSKLKEVVKT
jgi:hypothetical protein